MRHKVLVKAPVQELGNVDFEFDVWNDAGKLGTVQKSRGGVIIIPPGCSKTVFKYTWEEFFDRLTS